MPASVNPNTHWTWERLVQGPGQENTVWLQGPCVPGARSIPIKGLQVQNPTPCSSGDYLGVTKSCWDSA